MFGTRIKTPGMVPYGRYSAWVLLSALLFFTTAVFTANIGRYHNHRTIMAKSALLESLAISSLALSSECNSARNPLEGICNSAGDIPGGYPYHSTCDIVGTTEIPQQELFTLTTSNSKK